MERIVRFNKDMFYTLKSQLDDLPADPEIYEEIYDKEYSDLEQAPPKDWVPLCYTSESCDDSPDDIRNLREPCLSCPYRKRE